MNVLTIKVLITEANYIVKKVWWLDGVACLKIATLNYETIL